MNIFEEFISEIRPTEKQREDLKKGHTLLRERLLDEPELKGIIITTFLQGSYRRGTLIRPIGEKRSDVDVVVVTSLKKEDFSEPDQAMDKFRSFLKKHYHGKWKSQSKSLGIELSYVDLDLVISSTPSSNDIKIYKTSIMEGNETVEEVDIGSEWKTEPLWIPNRKKNEWQRTHPLEQIKSTHKKNKETNGNYTNVVKAIKWWQRRNYPNDRPKGYPLEYLVWHCCPNDIQSIEEGIIKTFENIVQRYSSKPNLAAPGVPEQNVFANIEQKEFEEFYRHIETAFSIAKEAYLSSSSEKWRELFGDKFPKREISKGPFIAPITSNGDPTPRRYG